MRKACIIFFCVFAIMASVANGAMMIEATPRTITPELEAGGWFGFALTIISDGEKIAGFDFANGGGGLFGSFHQNGPALGSTAIDDSYFLNSQSYLAWFDTPSEDAGTLLTGSAVIFQDRRDFAWDFAFVIINADMRLLGVVSDDVASLFAVDFYLVCPSVPEPPTEPDTPSVPEPTTLALLAIGSLALLHRQSSLHSARPHRAASRFNAAWSSGGSPGS